MYSSGKELNVIQSISEKYMTDEETDSEDNDVNKWRSAKCNQFLKKPDECYMLSGEKRSNSKTSKIS